MICMKFERKKKIPQRVPSKAWVKSVLIQTPPETNSSHHSHININDKMPSLCAICNRLSHCADLRALRIETARVTGIDYHRVWICSVDSVPHTMCHRHYVSEMWPVMMHFIATPFFLENNDVFFPSTLSRETTNRLISLDSLWMNHDRSERVLQDAFQDRTTWFW